MQGTVRNIAPKTLLFQLLAYGPTAHTHIPCLSTCLVNASCSCMMFYSWYQGYSHSRAIIFLCKPPVQVWLGLDNRKSAWRGDTTPQDVIEAIIMLSRRDVQELRLWRCSRNTSPLGACRNVCVVMPQLQNWKAEILKCLNQGMFLSPFCRDALEQSVSPWRSFWQRHHHITWCSVRPEIVHVLHSNALNYQPLNHFSASFFNYLLIIQYHG